MLNLPDSDPRVVAASQDVVEMRGLFRIRYSSTDVRRLCVDTDRIVTDPLGSNRQTWLPADDIVMASNIPTQGEVGRSQYTLTFTGNKTEFTGGNFHGIELGVFVTFREGNSTRFTDVLDLYRGRCMNFRLAKSGDEIVTEAEFSGELSGSSAMILTDSEQRRRASHDDILKFIDQSDRDVRWGLVDVRRGRSR